MAQDPKVTKNIPTSPTPKPDNVRKNINESNNGRRSGDFAEDSRAGLVKNFAPTPDLPPTKKPK